MYLYYPNETPSFLFQFILILLNKYVQNLLTVGLFRCQLGRMWIVLKSVKS